MLSRRAIIAGSLAALSKKAAALTLSTIIPSGVTNTTLATLTVVNNGGSTMSAGTVGTSFGWLFKKGDIPSGTHPQFVASGVVQPYSWGLQTYYTDGSLKFASFWPRWTFSLSSNGTQAVSVQNNGNAPTASSRTLTEVYAQGAQVSVTGANNSGTGITGANLTGALGAWLDSAANTNNNNWQVSVLWDGPAGKGWKVRCHMSATKAGSAQGLLEGVFYIFACQDSGGSLGGFRVLPMIETPWYNAASTNSQYAFQPAVAWIENSNTHDMVTAGTFPFSNAAFTVSGSVASTNAANNYYNGCAASGVNATACYVTGASLPTGLSANTLYFVQGNSGTNTVNFFTSNSAPISLGATGSGTIVPVNWINPFGRLPMPTTGGRWQEFIGTGNGNTGAVGIAQGLQVQIDRTYWRSTNVIPPYDLSIQGSINDNNWNGSGANYPWTPANIGPWMWNNNAGERGEIGILPNQHVIHFYTQTSLSDALVRISGYSGNLALYNMRDSTQGYGQIPNFNNASYTGLPALPSEANEIIWGGAAQNGFSNPAARFLAGEQTTDHQPCPAVWPYLITGEPQYLDIIIDLGMGAIAQTPFYDGLTNAGRDATAPQAAYGLITNFNIENRTSGWGFRNLVWAAALCPKPFYDGSQLWNNLTDLEAANGNWPNIILNPSNNAYGSSGGTAYICNSSNYMYTPVCASGATSPTKGSDNFELAYIYQAFCLAAGAIEDANALLFLQKIATRYLHIYNTFGPWCVYGYYNASFQSDNASFSEGWPPITSDSQWGVSCNIGPPGVCSGLSYASSGTTRFAWLGTNQTWCGYVPANNDKIVFNAPNSAIAGSPGTSLYTAYYLGDVSGNNFNLYTAINGGGSKIQPTSNGSISSPATTWIVPVNQPASSTGDQPTYGPSDGEGEVTCHHGAMVWMTRLGATVNASIISDAATRLTNSTAYQSGAGSFANIPKYSMAA